jgi:hypothetical protein
MSKCFEILIKQVYISIIELVLEATPFIFLEMGRIKQVLFPKKAFKKLIYNYLIFFYLKSLSSIKGTDLSKTSIMKYYDSINSKSFHKIRHLFQTKENYLKHFLTV